MSLKYKSPNNNKYVVFNSLHNVNTKVKKQVIRNALTYTHEIVDKFAQFDVDVFDILGMRNLSAFIGEIFASAIIKHCDGQFL